MATQNVNVVFRTIGGSQLNSQLRNLSQNTSMVSQSMARMQGHVSSMVGGFGILRVAAAGVLGGLMLQQIIQVGDEFERTGIKMAGFLQAMHLAPSYAAGVIVASDVMRKIRRDAAALPGEAEDYARVFTTALPEVSQTIGGSIDNMMAFTNQVTAVGTMFGIDSFQLAHDLQRMLYAGRGSAGFHVRLFNELMPFMRNVAGYANLNTKSFNAMSQAARGSLMQKALGQLNDMIGASKDSFDAMRGAASEAIKSIMRFGGMAVFNSIKVIMKGFASAILDADGNLTEFGKIFVRLGESINKFVGPAILWMTDKFNAFTDNGNASTQEMIDKVVVLKDKMLDLAKSVAKVVVEMQLMTAAGSFALAGGLTGGSSKLAGVKGVRDAKALSPLQTLGIAMVPSVVPTYAGPATSAAELAASTAAEAEAVGSAAAIAGITALGLVLAPIAAVVFTLTDNFSAMLPILGGFGALMMALLQPIGALFVNVWHVLKPIMLIMGLGVLVGLAAGLTILVGIFTTIADIINYVAEPLGNLFDMIYDKLKALIFWYDQANPAAKKVTSNLWRGTGYDMLAHRGATHSMLVSAGFASVLADSSTVPSAEPPPGRPGRVVHQDFRNSRFTVDQKFAEGFDPDRVAIAFANDLAKIGDQRTTSQFAFLSR